MSTDSTMPAPVANVSDLSPKKLQQVAGEIITHLQAPDRLTEIKARREALREHATPGDWRYDGTDAVHVFPADGGDAELVASIWGEVGSDDEEKAVGEFISHSPNDVDWLTAKVDRLTEERDQAIAHDRQPYPTQWAYDHACEALEKHRQRADKAEAERDGLRHALERAALSLEHDRDSSACRERCGLPPLSNEDCPACDAQAALQVATPSPRTRQASTYLVWSNDARSWWGPNGSGYTGDVWAAGRYDEANAIRACGMRTWSQGSPPPEVMVLAPEHDRATLTVDDIRAVPDLMRDRIAEATRNAFATREAGRG